MCYHPKTNNKLLNSNHSFDFLSVIIFKSPRKDTLRRYNVYNIKNNIFLFVDNYFFE